MKKIVASFLSLLFLTLNLHAADLLDPTQVLLGIVPPLSAAFKAAQDQASRAGKSPLADLLKLEEFVLPMLEPILGLNSGDLRLPKSGPASDIVAKIIGSSTIKALFTQENITNLTRTNITYALRSNLCDSLRADSELGDQAYQRCLAIVNSNKLSLQVHKDGDDTTFISMWETNTLGVLTIGNNRVSKTIDLGTVLLIAKEIKYESCPENLSGAVSFEFKFSTESKAANCPEQAISCISLATQTVQLNTTSGSNLSLNGVGDSHNLITVLALPDGQTKLLLTIDNLGTKVDFSPFPLSFSFDLNKLFLKLSLNGDAVILEDLSKGDGSLGFMNKICSLDINEGKNVPNITFTKNFLEISPCSISLNIKGASDNTVEKLTIKFLVGKNKLIMVKSDQPNPTTPKTDRPVSDFNKGSLVKEKENKYYFLNQLLNKTISSTQNNGDLGVVEGHMEVDYKYGEKTDSESNNWLGSINFFMSPGDFLKDLPKNNDENSNSSDS